MHDHPSYLSWYQACLAFDAVMSTGEVPPLIPSPSGEDLAPIDRKAVSFSVGYGSPMIDGPGNHEVLQTSKVGVRSYLQATEKGARASFEDGERRVLHVEVAHGWGHASWSIYDAIAQAALITQQAQRAALFMSVIGRFVIVSDHAQGQS